MADTRRTHTERSKRPTTLTRLAAPVVVATLHIGCTVFNGMNPCNPETGEISGWVFFHDRQYIDTESRPYALPGDRPFDECTIIRGNISLKGEITDFGDFDHIESIPGFYDSGSILDPSPVEGSQCGVIRGFPSLKRITWEIWDTGRNVEDPTVCYYLDGFESLEFVGRDFSCHGSDNLGTELVEVGGRLTCPEERLQKLERVGEYDLTGSTLPNLRWAGRLGAAPIEHVNLPLLEEVGPYQRPNEAQSDSFAPGLFLSRTLIRTLSLPSLRRVDGLLDVSRTGRQHEDIFVEGRAEQIKAYFSGVEITGRRIICENDPTDPCPGTDECNAQYGEGSLECCGLPWPTCLEMAGDAE